MKDNCLTLRWMALFISLSASSATASPGAWPQPEDTLLIIHNVSTMSTDKRFDVNGDKISQPTYRKYEYNPYIEYGLTADTTLGANLFMQRASSNGGNNWGVADSEFFVRHKIWQDDSFVFSAAPFYKLPSLYNTSEQPVIGSDHSDAGLRLLGGYSFQLFDRWHYAELETAYRYRFGEPKDQYHLNATLGLAVSDTITLMPQVFVTKSTQVENTAAFTQSTRDDYDLMTLQISALYRFNPAYAVQVGAFTHVEGRNTGNGGGALISLWTTF